MKKTQSETVRGYFIDIVPLGNNKWLAELWWNPYDGRLLAVTRPAKSRAQAAADGRRFLTFPKRSLTKSRRKP